MNIYEKIHAIMQEVEYLQKDDTVGYGRSSYKAITEEKVTRAVREAMVKHGVVIVPFRMEHTRDDQVVVDKDGNEKVNRLSTVNVSYRIQNIEDPEDFVVAVSSGTGVDTQDKGVGKAMTYAYKYLMLRTFAIPTGEDPDKTSSAEIDAMYQRKYITEREYNRLLTLCHAHDHNADWLMEQTGATNGREITTEAYARIVKELEQ